jgi:hypothetical protein
MLSFFAQNADAEFSGFQPEACENAVQPDLPVKMLKTRSRCPKSTLEIPPKYPKLPKTAKT